MKKPRFFSFKYRSSFVYKAVLITLGTINFIEINDFSKRLRIKFEIKRKLFKEGYEILELLRENQASPTLIQLTDQLNLKLADIIDVISEEFNCYIPKPPIPIKPRPVKKPRPKKKQSKR